jgi:hypothetical protein
MIEGAFSFASLNRSLTRAAQTQTNISTNSEPEIEKKGTQLSQATALASSVLPVPGGQTISTHLGIFAHRSLYFFGFLRKSTTSTNSSFSSSAQATSLNVILSASQGLYSLALDFMNAIGQFAPQLILQKRNMKMITNITTENMVGAKSDQNLLIVSSVILISVLFHFSENHRSLRL